MKQFIFVICSLICFESLAQNMTDLSVMNDRTADKHIVQSDYSTVDDSVFMHPDRIRFDHRCFQIDGQDEYILSGTMHYFRVPEPLWKDRLQKMKACGFNCVETYVPWNWHEREMPKSPDDESKIDLGEFKRFLEQATSMGLYVIVRPGPYICSEWSGGGFPQWLMRKKPANPLHEVWLQSNDPEFVRWNEHWYRVVCKVMEPFQIHHRKPGNGGVVLFQIENEFNRIKWFPGREKKSYLENLALIARKYGVEVPIITCWTNEARNVKSGPLNGIVDMVNSYPRWQISKNFGRLINQQLKSQPGKPLISGELQGGWYSDIGGLSSTQIDGIQAVNTQNITLYALQRGFCAFNYYMAVGGTNFDDWAARGVETSYDFTATIDESGRTGERYLRIKAMAPFIMQHGTKIARAKEIHPKFFCTDPDVEVVLRQTASGDRYYFVRTEDLSRSHFGNIQTGGVSFDFFLEPFGSMVYYIPSGNDKGEWFPKPMEQVARPYVEADTVIPQLVSSNKYPLPNKWKRLGTCGYLDAKGIYGRHFVYYKTIAPVGKLLEINRIGNGVVNGTKADTVLVYVNNALVPISRETKEAAYYQLPGDSLSGKKLDVVMLYESKGLHHHTNESVEKHWQVGIGYAAVDGKKLPLQYSYDPKVYYNQYNFQLPVYPNGITWPYHLHMEHTGNGFIYLNGHALGRCWEEGPQRDYYLPECWLNFGGENKLEINLRPTEHGADIHNIHVVPMTWAAYSNNIIRK